MMMMMTRRKRSLPVAGRAAVSAIESSDLQSVTVHEKLLVLGIALLYGVRVPHLVADSPLSGQ